VKEFVKSIAIVEDPSQQLKEICQGMCADRVERDIAFDSCQSKNQTNHGIHAANRCNFSERPDAIFDLPFLVGRKGSRFVLLVDIFISVFLV
jgi:hypothetical protein